MKHGLIFFFNNLTFLLPPEECKPDPKDKNQHLYNSGHNSLFFLKMHDLNSNPHFHQLQQSYFTCYQFVFIIIRPHFLLLFCKVYVIFICSKVKYKIFSTLIRLILSEAINFHAICLDIRCTNSCSSVDIKLSMAPRNIGKKGKYVQILANAIYQR